MKKYSKILASMLAVAAVTVMTSCDSDEPKMPDNPSAPTAVKKACNDIIYQANPRFYGNSDCINALTARLDNIEATGTTILWVMPINEFGQLNAINSPYCIRDFKAVDPKMGTEADLKALVDAAHARGMKVILDWIANHTAWDCAWVTEHPEWYVRDSAGNIVAPSGWTDVAELNYDNADMRAAMIDAMVYWIDAVGIDGYRCDHVDGVPADFWTDAITAIRAKRADALMLAESADHKYLASGFDMLYGWQFGGYITNLFKGKLTPAKFYTQAATEIATLPQGKTVMRYSINHDTAAENSVATLYGSDNALMAATVISTMLDGVPMFYDGNVISYTGTLNFFNYGAKSFNADRQARIEALGRAYKATELQRTGALATYQTGKVIMFSRSVGSKTVLVIANTTGTTYSVKMPISLAGEQMTDAFADEVVELPVSQEIEGYGYRVYYK